MKIAVLTDIHGNTERLGVVGPELVEADLVVVCGDVTNFGDYADAAKVIGELRIYNENILAVPGNCDTLDAGRYLVENKISLDSRCKVRDGVAFAGVGGSLPCPSHTPYEIFEKDFTVRLESIIAQCGGEKLVLVTHEPPYGTFADLVGPGIHVGSKAITAFIEKYKPRYCLCGHIHEAAGRGWLGETEIINPGPLKSHEVVFIEI